LNRKSYNSTVKEYSERIFRYAFKWTKKEDVSKDIVQEVFEKLWVNRKKVDVCKVKSWLFTTAHNLLANYSKKKKMISSEDLIYNEPAFVGNNYELQDLLEVSLNSLPTLQKSILLLRDSEGYDYKEIGEILNLNESQVKVYLFRARKKMKDYLKSLAVLTS
jgi:RNA polymerase sigma-70 factor (ECF subfamily)